MAIKRIFLAIRNRIALVGVRKFGVGSPLLKSLSYVPVHINELVSWEPDVIQSHDLSTLPLAIKAVKRIEKKRDFKLEQGQKKAAKVPVIFDSHELETHRNPPLSNSARRQVERLERRYLPQCDFVTTVSKPLEAYIREHYNVTKTDLIYNSPERNPAPVHPRWDRRKGLSVRRDCGVRQRDFLFVSVGLITVNRGLEMALEAMALLPTDIHYAVIGPKNKNTVKELLDLAREKGLSERFHLLDPVNPTDVYRYLASADAAILPGLPATLSYEFSLPNKFFECSFANLPLIASDLPDVKRLIEKYNLGVTYDAFDVHDCAKQILDVYNNRQKYKRTAEQTDAFITKFSWEAQAQKLSAIVKSVLPEETNIDPT